MKSFADDPECKIEDLPPDLRKSFGDRANEIGGGPAKKNGDALQTQRPTGLTMVVQRCSKAKATINEKGDWGEIGQGLLVSVSFAQGTIKDRVGEAARFLMQAKLSTAGVADAAVADSVANLCQQGYDQGILLMPQPSLVSEVGAGFDELLYGSQCKETEARELYQVLVEELENSARELSASTSAGYAALNPFAKAAAPTIKSPKIVASAWSGENQKLQFESSGPFMHSLNF
jgi:D-Tyr-tRNAtyr deacylase